MKSVLPLTGLLALVSIPSLLAEEESPSVPPAPIDFIVESTTVRQIEVVQPPVIPGLPETRKTVNVTVQQVADPGLPEPPASPPPPDPSDPAVQARIAQMRQLHGAEAARKLVPLSATWYPREGVSVVKWLFEGRSFEAVSRFDFRPLSGWNGELANADFTLLTLGVGVEDTALIAERCQRQGIDWQPPALPQIPAARDYVLSAGDPADAAGINAIEGIHAKFRAEGPQLEQAWLQREAAAAAHKAELLANPPQPQDITIRFWKRSQPATTPQEGGKP